LSDPNIHVWVARVVDAEHIEQSGEDVVGFCIAEHEPKNGRIGAIYVLPKYHGRGVGGKLMSTALGWLRNDGDIYVNVVSYNQHACSFYAHYDFVSTGRAVSDAVAVLPSGKTLPELEMVRKARI
jgi:GNAT superfamily N-acetyltransferase